MELVKLPQEVAEAIEIYWSRWSAEAHLKHIQLTDWYRIANVNSDIHRILISYAKEHPVEYMQALVNGYDVELAPGEIVLRLWNERHSKGIMTYTDTDMAYCNGMAAALNAFNIKVSGVNAK